MRALLLALSAAAMTARAHTPTLSPTLPTPGVAGCGNWSLAHDHSLTSSGMPLGLSGAQATKFTQPSGEQAFLLFGGLDYAARLSTDLWKYVPSENAWTQWSLPEPYAGPSGRIHHSMLRVTDPSAARGNGTEPIDNGAARILCFGGQNLGGIVLDDMWVFDPEADPEASGSKGRWYAVDYLDGAGTSSQGPDARYGHRAAATQRGSLIIFGGNGRNDVRLGDLWEFQIAWGSAYKAMPRGHWIERQQLATSQALGGPSARVFHSLVSLNLASEGRLGADLLMFGGQDASWSLLNDLWHYNDSSSAWTQVLQAGSPNTERPASRIQHGTAVVGATALVFGGRGISGDLDDLWELVTLGHETNLKARWRRVLRQGPSRRRSPAVVEVGGGVFLFGGFGVDEQQRPRKYLDDLWFFSACVCAAGFQRKHFDLEYGCSRCPTNTFKSLTGLMPCFKCPPLTFADASTGAAGLMSCVCVGGYTRASAQDCVACARGTYKLVGNGPCLQCPAGNYSAQPASTNCSACQANAASDIGSVTCRCNAGYTRQRWVCVACAPGTYKQNVSNDPCQICPPHATTANGSISPQNCSCPAGYSGQSAGVDCQPCATGFAKSSPGEGQCAQCPPGTFTRQVTGASVCVACAPGTFSNISGLYYNSTDADKACKGRCEQSLTTRPGATNAGNCSCPAGSGYNETAAACQFCPAGKFTHEAGLAACNVCAAGTISNSSGATACTACAHGLYGSTAGASACVLCPYNNTAAPTASSRPEDCSCAPGYHGDRTSKCIACPAGTYKDDIGLGLPVVQTPSGLIVHICTDCAAGAYSPSIAQSVCTLCPPDTFSGKVGATSDAECEQCPDNSQSPAGSTLRANCACNAGYTTDGGLMSDPTLFRCRPCQAGLYKDWVGQEICRPCPPFSSSLPGAARLVDCTCIPGYVGRNGSECSACAPGTFKNLSGPQECTMCSQGKFSGELAGVAETVCEACPTNMTSQTSGAADASSCMCEAGFQRSIAGDRCLACPPGFFKTGIGDDDCEPCQRGKYADRQASLGCIDCPNGTFAAQSGGSSLADCVTCAVNSHSPSASILMTACICNMGSTGPDGGPCISCSPGSYKNATGSALCTLCEAGMYSDTFAAKSPDTCRPCPENSLSLRGSRDKMQCLCSPGFTGPIGGPCHACAAGGYKSVNGSAPCQACAPGKFSELLAQVTEETCASCPNFTDSGAGSINVTNCTCNKGYTGPDGGSCSACPEGKYKDTFGTNRCSFCEQGKYSNETAAIAEATCRDCPENSDTHSGRGSTNKFNCSCNAGFAGADGSVCQACQAGTYKARTGDVECTPCIQGKYSPDTAAVDIETCRDCPQYSYSPTGSESDRNCTCNAGYTGDNGAACIPCSAGTFKAVNGSSSCLACANGTYSSGVAQISEEVCVSCPNHTSSPSASMEISMCICNGGYTGPDGAACVACVGGWKSERGSSPCIDCAAGKYALEAAGTLEAICYPCRENSHSPAGSAFASNCSCNTGYSGPDCEACAKGTYKAVSGNASCTKCHANSTTLSTAATRVGDCICIEGYAQLETGTCSPCSPGTYKDFRGNANCTICPQGTFAGESARMTPCTPCPERASAAAGSTNLTDCVCGEGYAGVINGTDAKCVACEPGKYKDSIGNVACTPCFGNATSDIGSSSRRHCKCIAGFTGLMNSDGDVLGCATCPPGTYSDSVSSEPCTLCEASLYSRAKAGEIPDDPSYCIACPPNSFSDAGSSHISNCTCERGRTSTNCVACDRGKYKNFEGQNECLACPPNTDSVNNGSVTVSQCLCNAGYERNTSFPRLDPRWGVVNANLSCIACGLGKFKSMRGNNDTCVPCPNGTYSNESGASVCYACPDGSTSESAAGIGSIKGCACLPGFSPGLARDSCAACSPGKYKEAVGNESCTSCPNNTYSSNVSAMTSSTCLPCPNFTISPHGSVSIGNCICRRGSFSAKADGGVACRPCRAGSFKNTTGAGNCSACPPHSYTTASGSVSVDSCLCDAGWTGVAASLAGCQQCAAGKYKNTSGSAACANCRAGTYNELRGAVRRTQCNECRIFSLSQEGSGNASACLCNAGYTQEGDQCKACEEGSYKNETGPGACLDCDVNAYTKPAATDVSMCTCNAGWTGANGGSCAACRAGYYKSERGDSGCVACTGGTFSETKAANTVNMCQQCPKGKSSPPASNSSRYCVCFAGYSRPQEAANVSNASQGCIPCKPGLYKEQIGDFECTACARGKYSAVAGLTDSANCTSCPSGATTLVSGATTAANCTCDLGYSGLVHGRNCTQCPPAHFKSSYGSMPCMPCRNFSTSPRGSSSAAACECRNPEYFDNNGTCTFQCPSGFYTSESGANCIECPIATFQPDFAARNASQCLSCGAGTYSPKASSSFEDCFCSAGHIGFPAHPQTGVSKDLHLAGNDSNASSQSVSAHGCVPCPENTYKEGLLAQQCTPCPRHSTSHRATPLEYPNKYDSTAPSPGGPYYRGCMCDEGFTGGQNLTCCFNATALPSWANITAAPVDQILGVVQSCMSVLVPGRPEDLGSTRAFRRQFPAENYSGPEWAGEASDCLMLLERQIAVWHAQWNQTLVNASLRYGPETAANLSAAMVGGFDREGIALESTSQALVCVRCGAGTYKPTNGTGSCLLCPNATYGSALAAVQLDGVCHACPANSTSDQGSTRVHDCQCLPGFSGANGSICTACAANTHKPLRGDGPCVQCPPNSFSPPASAWCHCNRGYEGPDAYLELRDVAALGQGNDDNGAVAERDAIDNILWASFYSYVVEEIARENALRGVDYAPPDITEADVPTSKRNTDAVLGLHWARADVRSSFRLVGGLWSAVTAEAAGCQLCKGTFYKPWAGPGVCEKCSERILPWQNAMFVQPTLPHKACAWECHAGHYHPDGEYRYHLDVNNLWWIHGLSLGMSGGGQAIISNNMPNTCVPCAAGPASDVNPCAEGEYFSLQCTSTQDSGCAPCLPFVTSGSCSGRLGICRCDRLGFPSCSDGSSAANCACSPLAGERQYTPLHALGLVPSIYGPLPHDQHWMQQDHLAGNRACPRACAVGYYDSRPAQEFLNEDTFDLQPICAACPEVSDETFRGGCPLMSGPIGTPDVPGRREPCGVGAAASDGERRQGAFSGILEVQVYDGRCDPTGEYLGRPFSRPTYP